MAGLGLGITISIKDNLSGPTKKASKTLTEAEKKAKRATAATKRLSEAMGPASARALSMASSFRRVALQFAGVAAIVGVGRAIFRTNVEFERLSGALKVATGSQEAANAKFKELEQFASTTPFALNQSVEGFLKLKNLGLDPSIRSLTSFGNTASSMGKDLMQLIEAVADASTFEFERLKEFGIKSKQQGDSVIFTFNNVQTKVKKNAKDIQKFLIGLGETKFAGAMEEQMRRLPGVVSNFGDSLSAFFRKIGTSGATKGLIKFIKAIGFGTEGTEEFAEAIGRNLGRALTKLAGMIKRLRSRLKEWTDSMGGVENAMRRVVSIMTVFFAVAAIVKIVKMVSAFLRLVSAIRAVGVAALFANGAIGLIPGLVIAAAIAIGVMAAFLIKRWKQVKEAFMKAAETVVEPWFTAFKAFFNFLKAGFSDSAKVAVALLTPFKKESRDTLKGLFTGDAFKRTGEALGDLGTAATKITDRGVLGALPLLDLSREFGKNLAPTVRQDFESFKRTVGFGGEDSGIVRSTQGDITAAQRKELRAPIKVENKVNIPKTTIEPADIKIKEDILGKVIFNIQETMAVRS